MRDEQNNVQHLKSSGGYLNIKGQLEALAKDKFDGYIAVETHDRPRLEKSRKCLEVIRGLAPMLSS